MIAEPLTFKTMEFHFEFEDEELPLIQVMNAIAFDPGEKGRKFDANFISVFNEERKEFEYFIQRLTGKEIENEAMPLLGKLWVPYINGRREDWSYICENNRIVAKEDEIIFRFEDPVMRLPSSPNASISIKRPSMTQDVAIATLPYAWSADKQVAPAAK